MNTEYVENYVGDEDCFSIPIKRIPNQYFKCPETGIELEFTYHLDIGWCVGCPKGSGLEVLHYKRKTGRDIPFPPTPKKYESHEKEFYNTLKLIDWEKE